MKNATLTLRVPNETKNSLQAIAKASNRSASFIAAHAIEQYIEENAWQIEKILKGIEQADKREYATQEAMRDYFAKHGINDAR